MLDIFDYFVLVLEPVIHLLLDVLAVFLEFATGSCLESFDPLILSLNFICYTLVQLGLSRKSLFFLYNKSFFNLGAFLSKCIKDLTFFLNTSVPLLNDSSFYVSQVFMYGLQLSFQGLNAIFSLLAYHRFKCCHSVMGFDSLILHVLSLFSHSVVELVC